MRGQELVNRLGREKSPYLRQHQSNPVAWFAWGDEAFAAARELERPIFLSIGYATCHWCHVMEGDSFETAEIAEVLNRAFISVKVDREELPDVDSFYMSALQAQTGQGGWPLSAFLTPEGKPFWMATFVQRARFKAILEHVEQVWAGPQRSELFAASDELTKHVSSQVSAMTSSDVTFPHRVWCERLVEACSQRYDQHYGGFSQAPKFPPSLTLMALARIAGAKGLSAMATKMLEGTCSAMIRGGIHDHLGGGFHRYATDDEWMIPHFEKMLYDNALLPQALLEAYMRTGNKDFAWSAERALSYVMRDLYAESEQAFYSAEDADSEKCEGKFYLWHYTELQGLLTQDELACLKQFYDLSPEGNFHVDRRVGELEKAAGLTEFEQGNIFHLPPSADFTHKYSDVFATTVDKLFKVREQRVRPLRDEKIICSWNALMISCFAEASTILDQPRYESIAANAANFILKHLFDGKELKRRYCEGEVKFAGVLEDYAYLIRALLDLYKASFDQSWLIKAQQLQQCQDGYFWDADAGSYLDSQQGNLRFAIKQRELHDHAIPSANAIACLNLLELSSFFYDEGMRAQALSILQQVRPQLDRYPQAFASFYFAIRHLMQEGKTLVVAEGTTGLTASQLAQLKRHAILAPTLVVVKPNHQASPSLPGLADKVAVDQQNTFYLCHWGRCEKPSHNLEEVLESAAN